MPFTSASSVPSRKRRSSADFGPDWGVVTQCERRKGNSNAVQAASEGDEEHPRAANADALDLTTIGQSNRHAQSMTRRDEGRISATIPDEPRPVTRAQRPADGEADPTAHGSPADSDPRKHQGEHEQARGRERDGSGRRPRHYGCRNYRQDQPGGHGIDPSQMSRARHPGLDDDRHRTRWSRHAVPHSRRQSLESTVRGSAALGRRAGRVSARRPWRRSRRGRRDRPAW